MTYKYIITGTNKEKEYLNTWSLKNDYLLLMKNLQNFDIIKVDKNGILQRGEGCYNFYIKNNKMKLMQEELDIKVKNEVIKILGLNGELTANEIVEENKSKKEMINELLELKLKSVDMNTNIIERKKATMKMNKIIEIL